MESNSFFKWIAIVDAIPKDWKILVKNNDCVANCGKEGFKICIKSEQYTLNFLSKSSLPPTNKARLNNIFDIQEEEWKNTYCLPKTVNVDHKTKELRYKILNNYLNTNARLKRIKILDDDLCSFCNEEAETLEHLFLSCAHVRKFWNEFLGWYLQFSQTEINIGYRTVVLGWRTADPPLLENFILLTAKSFIFRSKINSNPPSLTRFQKVLISYYLRKRYSCIKYNKKMCLMDKWSPLNIWLSQNISGTRKSCLLSYNL